MLTPDSGSISHFKTKFPLDTAATSNKSPDISTRRTESTGSVKVPLMVHTLSLFSLQAHSTAKAIRVEDIRANGRVLTDSIQKIHHSAVKKNGLIKAGSIIVATSATIGEHALVKVDCLTNQRFTCLTVKDEYTHRVDTMFLFYYMFKVDEWCKTHTVQGNFPGVDMSQFPNVLIPLPDIDEQRKIASILDHFDTLTNDLSQGLPAEIEARQQQYEYYRDQLLTFKRKEA